MHAFNADLLKIAKQVHENLRDDDFLERVAASDSCLLMTQGVKEIENLEFITFEEAVHQIAMAVIAGFTHAVDDSPVINYDVEVEVRVLIPEDCPERADFTLSVPKEDE